MNEGKYWDEGIMLVPGCTPVSDGCDNCWSRAMSNHMGKDFTPRFDAKQLTRFGKGKPRIISIWNDLFHEVVTDEQIVDTLVAMTLAPDNVYLVLTKRAERLKLFGDSKAMLLNAPNLWIGVTAENQEMWDKRVSLLLEANVAHPWVMCEPLLECIYDTPQIENLHWVIAGAETGSKKRQCNPMWLKSIMLHTMQYGVPFWGKSGYTNANRAYPKAITDWLNRKQVG